MELAEFNNLIKDIIGKPAWDVRLGYGSFILLKFGRRQNNNDGEWGIWVYLADWILSENGDEVAHSEMDREYLKKEVHRMEGRPLVSVDVALEAGETRFSFSEGIELLLRSYNEREYNRMWILFTPASRSSISVCYPPPAIEIEDDQMEDNGPRSVGGS